VTATLRAAGPADALQIAEHRDLMFLDSGRDPAIVRRASGMYRDWLAGALATDQYLGWFAEDDSEMLGSIGLWLIPWPHHPNHPGSAIRGYVTNMWVDPAHRRKGVGRQLLEAATAEAKARGATYVSLHATDAGRKLYTAMGWQPSDEMVLDLG
jgi:GNAT superfamily N-acetyltransferase